MLRHDYSRCLSAVNLSLADLSPTVAYSSDPVSPAAPPPAAMGSDTGMSGKLRCGALLILVEGENINMCQKTARSRKCV